MLQVPPPDESIARVDIFVLQGRGHYPVAVARIPGWVTPDLLTLIEQACALDPTLRPEDCVRSIWRLGHAAFRRNVWRRIVVPPKDRVGG